MRKHMTIRSKITVSSVALLVGAVALIGVFFWDTFYHTLEGKAYDDLDVSITRAEESLNSNFNQTENTLFTFFNTETFREWKGNSRELHPPENDSNGVAIPNEYYNVFNDVQRDISSILMFNNCWINKTIHSSYVIVDDTPVQLHIARSFLPNAAESFREVYFKIKDTDFQTLYVPPSSSDDFAYICKEFYNITRTKKLIFISSLDPHAFGKELYQLPQGITASLIDKNGTIYFSNNDDLIGKINQFDLETMHPSEYITNGYETAVDGKHQLVVLRQLENSNFSIVVSAPTSTFSDQIMASMMNYILIIILILIVFIFLSVTLSSVFTRFFKDITGSLNKIRNKDYDVAMPLYKERDLNTISTTFNCMTQEIKTLIKTVYEEQILLKEANIKQLQSQMNPHFLINTLTTVSTTALMHQDNMVFEMISALTEILDASLTNSVASNPFISVRQELNYINCYLYLQQIRFQDKLQYDIQVTDDSLLQLYLPRLSVEPLVENAVVHGIEDNINSGIIKINIYREADNLMITIEDNGKGFDVQDVFENNRHTSIHGHNISIKNTDQRFKLIFGEEYGVTFESEIGVKTIARIKVPILDCPSLNRGAD